jgi:hypothetical protein
MNRYLRLTQFAGIQPVERFVAMSGDKMGWIDTPQVATLFNIIDAKKIQQKVRAIFDPVCP